MSKMLQRIAALVVMVAVTMGATVWGVSSTTIHYKNIQSDAPVVMMPLQDILGLGEDARMNVPGKAGGNWAWQAREADIAAAEEAFTKTMHETGRASDKNSSH